jgi:hypothetical protein
MNRLVPLIVALVALAAGSSAAVFAFGASNTPPVTENSDEGIGVASACIEGTVDCDDTVEDVPLDDTMSICIADDGAAAEPCNDMIDTEPIPVDIGDGIGDCSMVHNVEACVDGPGTMPPIRSDEGIDPSKCNLVHNLDACTEEELRDAGIEPVAPPSNAGIPYELLITFNASVSDDDLALAEEIVRSFDPGAVFLLRESFPPVGSARLTSGAPDACAALEVELERSDAIDDATCSLVAGDGEPVDPDQPDEYHILPIEE